jgi:hypothetical protein
MAEQRGATTKPQGQWVVVRIEEVETGREMEGGRGQRLVTTER